MAARAGGPTYSSTAIVSVAPNPADPNGIDQVEYEVPVIVAAVESRSVGQQVEAQVGAAAVSEVNSLTAEREIESNIVRIEAEGSDPSAVADVANAAATVMLERYQPTDVNPLTPPERGDLVTLEVIDAAVPDAGSGYPNLVPIMLATVCLGLILAGASVALTQKWVRRRDLEGRIRTEVGVPVLAVIPGARELASEQVAHARAAAVGTPGAHRGVPDPALAHRAAPARVGGRRRHLVVAPQGGSHRGDGRAGSDAHRRRRAGRRRRLQPASARPGRAAR